MGEKYDAVYVRKLFRGVARNLSYPFQFVVFTEADVELSIGDEVEVRQISMGLSSWWNKSAALFGPEGASFTLGQPGDQILYLDLDTVICGSLDELASYHGTFAIAGTRDFVSEGGAAGGYNSSVISFKSRFGAHIHPPPNALDACAAYVKRLDHWLEMTIGGADTFQDLFPGHLVEYNDATKRRMRQKRLDDNAENTSNASPPPACPRIVTFPLKPKPHDVRVEDAPWVMRHW